MELNVRIQKSLILDFDLASAKQSALEDWKIDIERELMDGPIPEKDGEAEDEEKQGKRARGSDQDQLEGIKENQDEEDALQAKSSAPNRNSGDINTDQKLYYNGKGGSQGLNKGFDADKLLGGAGAKNTGGGAGGSTNLTSGTYGHIPNTQGNNGGSGFVILRIHLDDAFNPYSASL